MAENIAVQPSPLLGLDGVDWGTLWDCRGDVDQVPLLLGQLWEAASRTSVALSELRERLVPDHDLNVCVAMRDATPAAVPFLVRLAQDRRTPHRDAVLELLMRIADAADEGPVESCFGVWPEHWFEACGRALGKTNVSGWLTMLDDEPNRRRRRTVVRLLAIANRFCADRLLGQLWESVLGARDAEHLAERLIGLAYATLERPYSRPPRDVEGWAAPLKDWLEEWRRPSSVRTIQAVNVALEHLPGWVDADTVEALGELAREGLPHENRRRPGEHLDPSADR